jgi:hypothetical protein
VGPEVDGAQVVGVGPESGGEMVVVVASVELLSLSGTYDVLGDGRYL